MTTVKTQISLSISHTFTTSIRFARIVSLDIAYILQPPELLFILIKNFDKMTDTVVAPAVVAKAKKPSKPKTPALHPKYLDMIGAAVKSLKERSGSSRQAILKYIISNYKVGTNQQQINSHLKMALKAGVKNGTLKQSKGTGAAGSFKLGEKGSQVAKKAAKPKAAKPKAAKKSPKKKAATKKTSATGAKKADKAKKPKAAAKKPAAKKAKTPKKSASKPKKVASKSPKKAKTVKAKSAKKTPKKASSKK